MTKLSEHFTLEEMTRSTTAEIYDIDNTPTRFNIECMKILCQNVLEPARNEIFRPFYINSGFRCAALNKKVGGAEKSYHLRGMAADIHANDIDDATKIAKALQHQALCDLAIVESYKSKYWVHVQWSYMPRHEIKFIRK